jgi:hypothetical protein
MPTVRLSYHECLNGTLPPVCVVCGVPAESGVRFAVPTPFLLYAFGVLCTLCPPLFVLGVVVVSRKRRMQVPMCETHRAAWLRWDRALSWSYLAVVCGAYVVAVVLVIFLPSERVGAFVGAPHLDEAKWLLIPAEYFLVTLTWFVPASIRQTRHVRTTQATARDVRLSGVHAGFVRAVWEERAQDPARMALFGDARDDYDDEA